MSSCNQLDLQPVGSQPVMPKNLPLPVDLQTVGSQQSKPKNLPDTGEHVTG
jgi:hypothetical protein